MLILVKGGAALVIYEAIVVAQDVLGVWLELNHLLKSESVSLATAVQPQVEDGLAVDAVGVADAVVVELNVHEAVLGHELKLVCQVWNLRWIQLLNDLEESCSVTSALEEGLVAHGNCCDVHIRSLDEHLDVGLGLKRLQSVDHCGLSSSQFIAQVVLD